MVFAASKKTSIKVLVTILTFGMVTASVGFRSVGLFSLEVGEVIRRLTTLHSSGPENGDIKKFEFNITPEGFFRYKKIYSSGKSEYYSFSVGRLSNMYYLGTSASGKIIFETRADDIIVQTYNDPRGNVDSMSTRLSIRLQNAEAEDLQLIHANMETIRTQLQRK